MTNEECEGEHSEKAIDCQTSGGFYKGKGNHCNVTGMR